VRTRAGSSRSVEEYNDHCRDIVEIWSGIVGSEGEAGLRTVWIMGALTTALEAGIARPKTGEEKEWLRIHKPEFQKLADSGDEDFIGLLHELETRPEFEGI